MTRTKLVVEIDSTGSYTQKELELIAEQICNFLAGPDGEGLPCGEMRPRGHLADQADSGRDL